MSKKTVGQKVTLRFNSSIRRALIEKIETDPESNKTIFHLISPFGHRFILSKDEIDYHEVVEC